jgi:colicin import membrane protein
MPYLHSPADTKSGKLIFTTLLRVAAGDIADDRKDGPMNDAQTIDKPEAGTEVAILGTVTALTVFGAKGGVDAILAKITEQARSVETDISTPAGRRAVASLAYKIARSKTTLDAMGKDLGEQNYRAWKAITAERSRIETALDELGAKIRKPLTDWENAEKARVATMEAAIDTIAALPRAFVGEPTIKEIDARIARLNDPDLDRADWAEFSKRAADARAAAVQNLMDLRQQREETDARRAQEEREHQEAIEREQRAREALAAENARREAEEKARIAAEAEARRVEQEKLAVEERVAAEVRAAAEKARREQEAIEAARLVAEARARKAEEDRIAEAEQHRRAIDAERRKAEEAAATAEAARKAAAEQAAAAERKRITDKQERDAAETTAREANLRHRGRINGEARDALVKEAGLSEKAAATAVVAIASGKVPHTRISY